MPARVWMTGDLAVIIDNGRPEKVEIQGQDSGFALVRLVPSGEERRVDPAILFPDSIVGSDIQIDRAIAELPKRLLLSEVARLSFGRGTDINVSIYDDDKRGRVIAVRAGGAKDDCFDPSRLLIRFELKTNRISPDSPLWELVQRSDPDKFLDFFLRFSRHFPSGSHQIWGAEYGSDVE